MYTLTILEGTLLALVMFATVALLALGVLRFFPRVMHAVTAGVDCPLIRQRATAQFARDEWTRRFVDVTSCSVLGTPGVALCRKGCLLAMARSPRFTRS
ncbi:MAG TPA: hypothetical protein VHT71_03225 [Methylomirabilota bacterium]|jgi:hypothetical protein|nr:hypothetical protein [Methylomirabilota bacterium]